MYTEIELAESRYPTDIITWYKEAVRTGEIKKVMQFEKLLEQLSKANLLK